MQNVNETLASMGQNRKTRIIIISVVGLLLILMTAAGVYYYVMTQTNSGNSDNVKVSNVEYITPKTETPLQPGEAGPGAIPVAKNN